MLKKQYNCFNLNINFMFIILIFYYVFIKSFIASIYIIYY